MILSERGARFIEHEEGYRANVYNDSAGFATIGIGHLLHRSAFTAADAAKWNGMTLDQAIALMQTDAAPDLQAIQHYIHVELTQPQVDALCSFLFNCGPGAIANNVQKTINAGQDVTPALVAWAHPPELLGRRQREAKLFIHGDYGDGQPAAGAAAAHAAAPVDPNTPPAKLPAWFWSWAEWRLGRGQFKGHGHDPALRIKTGAPDKVPPWALELLQKFIKHEPIEAQA